VVEPVTKLPTRSPTHEDVPIARLASMGLELEEIAEDEVVGIEALAELAEDRGRPASHYLAAVSLATELRVGPEAPVSVRVCVGTCQRYGALDMLDHLVERWRKAKGFVIAPVSCLDQCDKAPACEVHGAHGKLVIAPTTTANLDEALDSLAT
jgi:NADH:ubiquinone oxidoreductase subunit E